MRFGTEGVGFVVSGLRSRFGIFGADFEVKDPGSWFQRLGFGHLVHGCLVILSLLVELGLGSLDLCKREILG